ncbi:hypothetical protein ACOME3_008504 [Neoechinorhynchus agilis]
MLTEKSIIPFNEDFIKQLTDSMSERRIVALSNISELTIDLLKSERTSDLEALIVYLSRSFALSQTQALRLAGLNALMSIIRVLKKVFPIV